MVSHSYSDYIRYKEYLIGLDVDLEKERFIRQSIIDGKMNTSKIRKRFLNKVIRIHGSLFCFICGKPDLVKKTKIKFDPNLATIDHVVPLSDNGMKYNDKNFICSCLSCNNKRGNKPLFKINEIKWIF